MEGRISVMQSSQLYLHIMVMMVAMLMVARAELPSTTWERASNVRMPLKMLQQPEQNLSEAIWDGAADLLPDVWRTKFLSGVKDGTLDADFYGAYSMQDAAWCKAISSTWQRVVDNETAPQELRSYGVNSTASFLEVAQYLWATFTVVENGSSMGTDATSYANFVSDSVTKYGSPYIMIATFACSKLWDNVTLELNSTVQPSSPYYNWVQNSLGSSAKHAAFIDTWAAWYDRDLSIAIFRDAMRGEIGLFNMTHASGVAVKSRKAMHGETRRFGMTYVNLY